ncbi:D-2-hydroxyacid dehydrogenase [Solihabitans fulvus]|uniref:D-2-hydroxyacid dehydrogenase n=1 Tax=Solihabitans fulvus TaxID=1892852 RepID=A0A5B2WQB2_9PSEU|nr:D-2-hydroxyacid dehydrogenase [Solihabitans fulvus]KAA2252716.1 D-2-hydroxyacid dehydrogenase [Solihabitans fulvus]
MSTEPTRPVDVLIASPLRPEHVELIAAVDPRVRVHYAPDLLPVPAHAADHTGTPRELTAEQRRRWRDLLAVAEVSFGLDWSDPAAMPANCPRLRWVQGTSAGMGGYLAAVDLLDADFAITTAAGVHGRPLAEFAVAGVLHFVKDVPGLLADKAEHRWVRRLTAQLAGRRVLVVGLGGIGREMVAVFAALGAEVRGIGRAGRGYDIPDLAETRSFEDLDGALPDTDVLVLCCPLTEQTTGLLSRARLDLLPRQAIVVNVARGAVLDEPALLDALRSGRLAGACLDVVATEPLPADSPVWDTPNLLLSPHSAANAAEENERIVTLFAQNLLRYLAGRPLRNLFDPARGY